MSNLKCKQFTHPFTKEYWKTAALEIKKPHILIFAAILIALRVGVKGLSIPIATDIYINLGFFINALGAMIYGPVMAIFASCISDTLGCLLFPKGAYFFPFIFIEIAGSLIFALFLYKTKITTTKIILSRFFISFFVNIVLNAPIMALYYELLLGKSYMFFQLPRIVKNLVLFPIECVLLILFLNIAIPVFNKIYSNYSTVDELKITKKNIVLIASLVVFSILGIFAYLAYN